MLNITKKQRRELRRITDRSTEAAGLVRRVRVVLLSADGLPGKQIGLRVDHSPEAVSRIRAHFRAHGVEGLNERPRAGRQTYAVPATTVERIVQLAMSPPPGRIRWTTRLLGKEIAVTSGCVSHILSRNDLKLHLVRTYTVSRDPDFAAKVEDVVGLYLNPPSHAVVLSVDQKNSIQALERTQLPLPTRTGRVVRHTHAYKRHDLTGLFAALGLAIGKVTDSLSESHTGADFLAFIKKGERRYRCRDPHVILDNSSIHSPPDVQNSLAEQPRVHFHYTPTSASWLNQVEGFVRILGKQSRGTTGFPSKRALGEHIAAYLEECNKNPTPFEGTKLARVIIRSHRRTLRRISAAVH
jgi:hypothetical protein